MGWVEEIEAVGMVGGWVGGWVEYVLRLVLSRQGCPEVSSNVREPHGHTTAGESENDDGSKKQLSGSFLLLDGWVGGWVGRCCW